VRELRAETKRRTQLLDMTAQVQALLDGMDRSLVALFVPHTTAGAHQALLLAELDGPRERTIYVAVTR
jgi:thiamine phosphate synthase YjbQ (UPF0047 family)